MSFSESVNTLLFGIYLEVEVYIQSGLIGANKQFPMMVKLININNL